MRIGFLQTKPQFWVIGPCTSIPSLMLRCPGPSSSLHPRTIIQTRIGWTTFCERNYQSHRAVEWQGSVSQWDSTRVSSMNSLSVVGSRANLISAMQSSSPYTKTRKKGQIAPTIGGSFCSSLQKNPCLFTPKQISTHHCWRPSTRNWVWDQSQQGYHRHDVCPQTSPREMPGAEQRTVCSVCEPDQSVWHCEQRHLWIFPHRQWRETGLCSSADSVQHLFLHDA